MAEEERLLFRDKAQWTAWLETNHESSPEAWLIFHKKHLRVHALEYQEALEEAIRFGWIDGKLRRVDDKTHVIRFSPRKPDSVWSAHNRRRAERIIRTGRMTAHGMAAVEAAKENGQWEAAYTISSAPKMPADLKEALMRNKNAWSYFSALANSYKQTYVFWVASAKREETRKKRIREVVKRTSEGRKLYP